VLRLSRYLPAVVFVLAISLPVVAQRERDTYSTASPSSFDIVGQVRLAESGLPASKIPIRLERFGGGIVDQIDTDSTGRFRFAGIQRGYYRVMVKAHGYRLVQQDADLQVLFRVFLIIDLVSERAGAVSLIDVIDAKAPPNAREELARGRSALVGKSYDEAVSHLQKAISFYPQFYEAHLLLGTAFVDTREWLKAEESFRRAVELKAGSSAALLLLGEVYWRQKRYDEAEKTLLEGLKLDEKSWHGYFTLGRLYWDQENIPKAGAAIGRTLQLKPDFAEAHLLAGNILLRVNQPERALLEYQEYLRLEPKGEFVQPTRELVKKLSNAIAGKQK
jgi:tetratricopeptide (TPR) repeat protein